MTLDPARSSPREAGRRLAALAGAIAPGAGALLIAGDGSGPRRGGAPRPAAAPGPIGGAAPAAALDAPAMGGERPGGDAAQAHLALGEALATRNAAGAEGATREGLLRAAAELTAALQLGCARPAAAQRLLASTYAALAQDWAVTDAERREYEGRVRAARREIVALSPGDALARYEYAVSLDDRPARIQELGEAVRLAPRDPRPRRLLGEDLLEGGSAEEGARQLVEAAELSSRDELEADGIVLLRLLRVHGREQEEAQVRERLERLGL